jgi:hypothetical protein
LHIEIGCFFCGWQTDVLASILFLRDRLVIVKNLFSISICIDNDFVEAAYLFDIASVIHDLDDCSFTSCAGTFREFLETIGNES